MLKRSPDRIEERAALLEKSESELRECAGNSGLFFISVLLTISPAGVTGVSNIDGAEDYKAVVDCIENVLLGWRFEPAPVGGFLAIPLFLKDTGR